MTEDLETFALVFGGIVFFIAGLAGVAAGYAPLAWVVVIIGVMALLGGVAGLFR